MRADKIRHAREWEEAEIEEMADDGLGAARGLWSTFRLLAWVICGATWVKGLVHAWRDGMWTPFFLATACLCAAVLAFNHLKRNYPNDRLAGISVTVIGLVMFFRLIW